VQDVLLSLVDDDHFTSALHQICSADPWTMGPRALRFHRIGLG
jgi:hypothetical protein